MSRRRGEFEHRTSIFEGAFRAWSHLGGLDPVDVETKPASELDPLTNPIEHDPRLGPNSKKSMALLGVDGSSGGRREYPYEPLPRAGLAHPYVQAILSPWLGPDADNEAIQLGLTTLRTWWQHRRKGESGSAVAALGTEKMKGVVEGYTRHFFTLAHCLIVNDKEQPPRSLHIKMKDMEKARKRGGGGGGSGGARSLHAGSVTSSASTFATAASKDIMAGKLAASMAMQPVGEELVANLQADLTDTNLTPLERLHAAQRRQLAEASGLSSSNNSMQPIIPISGRCVPGKIDLPGIVDAVTRQASQMVHRGALGGGGSGSANLAGSDGGGVLGSSSLLRANSTGSPTPSASSSMYPQQQPQQQQQSNPSPYGDPNTTPVVFVSGNGDIQIAMTVEGITCAHCVKIVETVLKGCNGNKSPIEGLLDAAADRALCSVLIKIYKASSAKRIAYEASRNLAMVGYTAKAKEMPIVSPNGSGATGGADRNLLGNISTAFEVVATTDPKDFFDWTLPCNCPDNGVVREDCPRHSQMNTGIFEAFSTREAQVADYMAGCGMKLGMACTCGPDCRCKNCPTHGNTNGGGGSASSVGGAGGSGSSSLADSSLGNSKTMQGLAAGLQSTKMDPLLEEPLHIDQPMEFDFGMDPAALANMTGPPPLDLAPGKLGAQHSSSLTSPTDGTPTTIQFTIDPTHGAAGGSGGGQHHGMAGGAGMQGRRQSRNPSILSYGNTGLRNMSLASDATFGRAMSGLSALSIDWENLEDFDLEVDHSAHINNNGTTSPTRGDGAGAGRRRSSVRRSFMSTGEKDGSHVTFKVTN